YGSDGCSGGGKRRGSLSAVAGATVGKCAQHRLKRPNDRGKRLVTGRLSREKAPFRIEVFFQKLLDRVFQQGGLPICGDELSSQSEEHVTFGLGKLLDRRKGEIDQGEARTRIHLEQVVERVARFQL